MISRVYESLVRTIIKHYYDHTGCLPKVSDVMYVYYFLVLDRENQKNFFTYRHSGGDYFPCNYLSIFQYYLKKTFDLKSKEFPKSVYTKLDQNLNVLTKYGFWKALKWLSFLHWIYLKEENPSIERIQHIAKFSVYEELFKNPDLVRIGTYLIREIEELNISELILNHLKSKQGAK